MAVNIEAYRKIKEITEGRNATLVAVSKTKPVEDILELYELGQRDFGENYVQELVDKYEALPKDIRWHFIGHLQSNKVKYIAPFVYLIHGIDSEKLLAEVNKQGLKNNRMIDCLLQVHIAEEETKFGFDENELQYLMKILDENNPYKNVAVRGLMGMASFSNDKEKLRKEFAKLVRMYEKYNVQGKAFSILSMGMSGDYELAMNAGSNMVRIGSLLFGERNYSSKL